MTVGTGIGNSQEKIDSLAHGLLFSIKETRPDYTIFFGSELSKKTISSLKKQYNDEFNLEFEDYEFVLLNDIDDFNKCFHDFKEKIIEYENNIIKIDYTSGTKTMTMTAATVATIYRKDLYLVSGKRGEDGIVIKGTEYKITQNLYQIYDKFTLDKVKESFNHNRFETGIELLKETRDVKNKESYTRLLNIYNNWDKFNHEDTYELFQNDFDKEFVIFPELQSKLYVNKTVIDKIVKPNQERVGCFYKLADLLNNADRRAKEGKYDDAIARLYRSLELIAQIKLRVGYKLKTSNIDINSVEKRIKNPNYINKLKQKRNKNKIKLGLNDSFEMLNNLGNELGKLFFEIKGLDNQRSLRNMSILAHGLEHRTSDEFKDFRKSVMILARKLDKNIEKIYMEEAHFPKFKV
jgi:CRISPR-associated protein (TIGR02710 family)